MHCAKDRFWLKAGTRCVNVTHQEAADFATSRLLVVVIQKKDRVNDASRSALAALGRDVYFAIRAIARGRPDVLLTDYSMPGRTGVDLAIKARELMQDLPVLIATGHANMDGIEASIEAGALLRKPSQLN